jgi:hypothetical protein
MLEIRMGVDDFFKIIKYDQNIIFPKTFFIASLLSAKLSAQPKLKFLQAS